MGLERENSALFELGISTSSLISSFTYLLHEAKVKPYEIPSFVDQEW